MFLVVDLCLLVDLPDASVGVAHHADLFDRAARGVEVFGPCLSYSSRLYVIHRLQQDAPYVTQDLLRVVYVPDCFIRRHLRVGDSARCPEVLCHFRQHHLEWCDQLVP